LIIRSYVRDTKNQEWHSGLKISLSLICVFLLAGCGLAQNTPAPTDNSGQNNPPQTSTEPSPAPSPASPQATPPPETAPSNPTTPATTLPDNAQTGKNGKKPKTQEELEIERKEQSNRVLGVLPQFGVTSRQDAPALEPHQKFHLFLKSAFDPVNLGVIGLQAGLSQAQDSFPAYGQGMEGYGKRYGAALADSVSSGFFSNFAYPVLLKEDPRYFRLGEGTIKHRIGYGIKQEFVCHTDSGGRRFAFSNVLGALTAGSISNAYYPDDDRGFGLTMSRAGIALLYGTAGGLFDEFWPDIHDKLFHKKSKERLAPDKPHTN
jgi:hypothetical protein